jgi:hypothetical protein
VAGEPPPIEAGAPTIARTERMVVGRPPAEAFAYVLQAPLEEQIPQTRAMPGVTGTTQLRPGAWGGVGARRIVHLSDGSSVTEQILEQVPGEGFRYQVWDYTTPAAAGVAYALGEFRFLPLDEGRTEIVWTYSFRLRGDRFPGMLGPVGRGLMQAAFLDRGYAELMRATLAAIKAGVARGARQAPAAL